VYLSRTLNRNPVIHVGKWQKAWSLMSQRVWGQPSESCNRRMESAHASSELLDLGMFSMRHTRLARC